MAEIDELERLVRLRDSGALTQDEFMQSKSLLLAKRSERHAIGAFVRSRRGLFALSGIIVLTLGIVFFSQQAAPWEEAGSAFDPKTADASFTGQSSEASNISAGLSSTAFQRQNRSAGKSIGSYDWATSSDRMFENPDYIQEVLGTPTRRSSGNLFYNVEGCFINYIITDFAISGIQMGVSDECAPSVNGRTITSRTTFGTIYEGGGFLMAACLRLCGNRADPTIEYVLPGPHANAFIGVSYSTIDTAESETWEREIARNLGFSDIWDVPSEKFLCPPKPSTVVYEAMKDATISNVTIQVDAGKCPSWFE